MRVSLLLLFSLISSFLVAQAPTNGLIACYGFDSDASDVVNGYDGTLLGNASATTVLTTGYNSNDALSLPGNILNNVSEFSIAFEVTFANFNTNHVSSSNVFFSGASIFNDNLMNFAYAKNQLYDPTTDQLQNTIFYIHDNVRYEVNNINLTTGVSYHFVIVRGQSTLKFYIDGIEQTPAGGLAVPPLNLSLAPNGFIFGQDQDVLAGGFESFQSLNGSMDNLLIYDRALTAIEVDDVFKADHELVSSYSTSQVQFSIFPNPTSDLLQIESDLENPIVTVRLFNAAGSLLQEKSEHNSFIHVGHLPVGSYLIEVTTKQGQSGIRKFTKH